MVRGGRDGEREKKSLDEGLVIVGWDSLGDISFCRTREELRKAIHDAYPDAAKNVVANWTGQLWRLVKQISNDDLAVMPLKTHPGKIAIGRFVGPYEYREEEPMRLPACPQGPVDPYGRFRGRTTAGPAGKHGFTAHHLPIEP